VNRSVRVLVYTENHDPGGGNRYLTDFLASLPAGSETVLCCNRGGLFPDDLGRLGPRLDLRELPIRSEGGRLKQLGRARALRPFLLGWKLANHAPFLRSALVRCRRRRNRSLLRGVARESRFSLAIAFNGGFPAALSCFDFLGETVAAGIPSLMCVVSMPTTVSFRDSLYRGITKGITGFVVNCEAIKRDLSRTRGIPVERIHVLHNAVSGGARGRAPIKGGGTGPVRFGFIGRMEASKGIFVLIEALGRALKVYPDIRLLLFGRVCDRAGLLKAAARWGCESAVEVRGPFEGSVFEVLSKIDVCVLPSFREGLPYVILEAMAAGVAVVATDVGGVSEAVSDGETGVLVPAGDPQALAEAMQRVAGDPLLRSRFGESARQRAEKRFTPPSFAMGVSAILAQFGGDQE
jgi:glycosyltransferase involved in cell wall biosynthesis